jgi:hypothetical protein
MSKQATSLAGQLGGYAKESISNLIELWTNQLNAYTAINGMGF